MWSVFSNIKILSRKYIIDRCNEMEDLFLIKHIYHSTKGFRIIILLLLVGLAAAMLTEAQFDRVIGNIVDALFYSKNYEFVGVLAIYFGYFCANQIAYLCLNMVWMYLRNSYLLSLRNRCFEHLLNLKSEYLQSMKSGEFNKLIQEDIDCYLEFIYRVVFYIMGNIIFLLYALFYILRTNLYLGLLTIALLPFIFMGNKKIKDSIKNENANLQNERASANIWVTEKAYGIRELIMLRANGVISQKYDQVNEKYNEKKIHLSKTLFWNQKIIDVILLVGQLLLFYLGVYLFIHDKITIGSLIATIGYYLTCKGLLASIYVKVTNGFTTMTGIERVYNFLQRPERDNDNGCIDNLDNGTISFEGVSFSYEEKEILNNISIEISEGRKVAIIGENGCGKSTFMGLCYGLFHPSNGRIMLGERSINEYSRQGLIKDIGVVQQDSIIYDNTLLFNIALGNETNEEWIYIILEELGLSYLINENLGLNSIIGRNGRELSGGERQRVGIARSIYRKPKILLLDEFTSSLDYQNSIKVDEAIQKLLPDSTIIYISHKHAQIERAELTYRLSQGKMFLHGENI